MIIVFYGKILKHLSKKRGGSLNFCGTQTIRKSSRVIPMKYMCMFFTQSLLPPSKTYFIIVIGFLLKVLLSLNKVCNALQAITRYSSLVFLLCINVCHFMKNMLLYQCWYVLISSVTKYVSYRQLK